MPVSSNGGTEKTEVKYGIENTSKIILEFLSRANKNLDIYGDNTWPSVSMGINAFKRAMQNVKKEVRNQDILSKSPKIIFFIVKS